MSGEEKKKFLLRIESDLFSALEKWATQDLRSVNAQIEFLLSQAVKKAGRWKREPEEKKDSPPKN